MYLALPVEDQFVGVHIVIDRIRRIFLHQLCQRRGHFHLVIAPLHFEGDRVDRRQRPVPREPALATTLLVVGVKVFRRFETTFADDV